MTTLALFVPERVNKVFLIVVGCFTLMVGAFLTGPSRLFGLPNKIGIITAGMITSGVGKALIQSYSVTYAIMSGQEAFPEGKEEVERRIPLMLGGAFGMGAFVTPILMSALYKAVHFRSALDILGVIFSVNAVAFTVHAGRSNWGRKPGRDTNEESEEQPMLQPTD